MRDAPWSRRSRRLGRAIAILAIAAPEHAQNATTVMSGTADERHGAMSRAARPAHVTATPPMYQFRRVRQPYTTGAHRNSNESGSRPAAMMAAVCWTGTPAFTRQLLMAGETTPTGHAVHRCRKKKAYGGARLVKDGALCWWHFMPSMQVPRSAGRKDVGMANRFGSAPVVGTGLAFDSAVEPTRRSTHAIR